MTIRDDPEGGRTSSATIGAASDCNNVTLVSPLGVSTTSIPSHSAPPLLEQPDDGTPFASSLSQHETAADVEEERRIHHWKESEFAVGLVDVTWADSRRNSEEETFLRPSAWICPLLGARRVGNMAVLWQSRCYEEIKYENGTVEHVERPKLVCVAGPHWIVTALLTFPIILVVTAMTARKVVNEHVALIAVWSILTFSLIVSLLLVACRNPGIMYRYPYMQEEDWRWNDQARTFRPKSAKFDPECAVVIEGFDHT